MADDTFVRTVGSPSGSIQFGGSRVPIVDPHGVVTVFADIFTNIGELNGVVGLSLATFVVTPNDAEGKSHIEGVVCARLRFNLATALDLRNALDGVIKNTMPPKEQTN